MEKSRSVYSRGADNGLILGPLLTVVAIMMGATSYVPWLFLPTLLGMAVVPVVVYAMLGCSFRADGGKSTFSALWLQGICAFFFGSLIMGLMVYIAMRWVYPSYILDQMHMLADMFAARPDPDSQKWVTAINRSIAEGAVPTPITMAMELIYVSVFTGSLLSMIMALMIRSRRRGSIPPPFKS